MVGATVMAVVELTVGPYLRVGDAQPHLVLVVGIVVTVAVGLEAGLVWDFVGGLVLDVLAQRPLGSTAFALLLCMGATAVMARPATTCPICVLTDSTCVAFSSTVTSSIFSGSGSRWRSPSQRCSP